MPPPSFVIFPNARRPKKRWSGNEARCGTCWIQRSRTATDKLRNPRRTGPAIGWCDHAVRGIQGFQGTNPEQAAKALDSGCNWFVTAMPRQGGSSEVFDRRNLMRAGSSLPSRTLSRNATNGTRSRSSSAATCATQAGPDAGKHGLPHRSGVHHQRLPPQQEQEGEGRTDPARRSTSGRGSGLGRGFQGGPKWAKVILAWRVSKSGPRSSGATRSSRAVYAREPTLSWSCLCIGMG